MPMLWIQSRVDYILNLHQILYKRTAQQQQKQPAFHHPSKGLDSSKLEHTWFSTKEMWDILKVTHEGTIDVKNNKDKNQPSNRYNSKNVNEFNSTKYNCFGYGK